MKQIEIVSLKKYDSYSEISYKMRFELPVVFGTKDIPIKGLSAIIQSINGGYNIEEGGVEGSVITYTNLISLDLSTTLPQIKSKLINQYGSIRSKLDNLSIKPIDTISGLSYDGTNWI